MSKKKKIIITLTSIAVVGGLFYGISNAFGTPPAISVPVTEVTKQTITSDISTSGDVKSLNIKTYFSPVNATISNFTPRVGDVVKAGTVLVSFDTSMLEIDNQKATLNSRSVANGNQATLDQTSQANASISNAKSKTSSLASDISKIESEISSLTKKISNKSAKLQEARSKEVAPEITRISTLLNQVTDAINALDSVADVTKINELEINKERYQKELDALQSSIANASDAELAIWQTNLQSLQTQLGEKQGEYQAAKGASDSATPSSISNAARAQMTDNSNLAELEASSIEELLVKGREGIKADFDGIISAVEAVEGSSAMQGSPLFSIADNKNVIVDVAVSKYDYNKIQVGQKATIELSNKTYTGSVESISRIAEMNADGSQVIHATVKILNPDDDIFLGVEAKVKIQLGEKKNVLVVDRNAINTDKDGDFVYLLRDGKIVTVPVKTGLSSTELIEIESGVSAGDQVITELPEGVEVGDSVIADTTNKE